MLSRLLLPILTIAVLVCALTPQAHAQSLSGLLSSSGSNAAADFEELVTTATDAFRSRAQSLIASGPNPGELQTLIDDRAVELETAIRDELQPLRMDGLLGQTEATRTIGQVSETAWINFAEAVEAHYRGVRTPPRRSEFDSSAAYAWDMAKYILADRNGLREYLILAAAVTIGIGIAWAGSIGLTRLRDKLRDREYKVLPSLVAGLRGPLYVTLTVAGIAAGVAQFWLPKVTQSAIWTGIRLAIIAASLWLVLSLVNLGAQGLGWMLKTTYREPDKQTVAIIRRSLHLLVLAVYAAIVAEFVFGVELYSVLIGVGLFGIAITLAAQDSLKNLFGSLTLVMDRPFRVGDLIEFQDYFGTVEDIGFRSTKLREFDGHLVTIPNAHLVRESVENIDARPWVRRRYRIGIRYDTPPDKVREALSILEDIFSSRDDNHEDMPPHAVFEGFGDFSLNLLVQFCLTPGEYWEVMHKGSDLHLEILDRFNQAGIEFAFPTQTAVLETDDQHPARIEPVDVHANDHNDRRRDNGRR